MSVLTTLAYLVSGFAARPKGSLDVENTKLQAKVDELTRALDETRIESDRWRALAESWRRRYEIRSYSRYHVTDDWEAAYHLMNANANRVTQIGAQTLQLPAEWLNCVPGRHDIFLSPRS